MPLARTCRWHTEPGPTRLASVGVTLAMGLACLAQPEPDPKRVVLMPLKALIDNGTRITHLPGTHTDTLSLTITAPKGRRLHWRFDPVVGTPWSRVSGSKRLDRSTHVQVTSDRADTVYAGTYFINDPSALDRVALSVMPEDFLPPNGIYVGHGEEGEDGHTITHGRAWTEDEIRALGELVLGDSLVHAGAFGMRVFGGMTRGHPEKSLRIIAREKTGGKPVRERLFPSKAVNRFQHLVLRTSGGDQRHTRFKDVAYSSLAADIGLDHMGYRPVTLFVNGDYWGIHNLREKINPDYLRDNHAVDADSVLLIQGSGTGNKEYMRFYGTLAEAARNGELLQVAPQLMDVENYMNFIILQTLAINTDSRGNIRFWRANDLDGRWRWIVYDTDLAAPLGQVNLNFLAKRLEASGSEWYNPSWANMLLRTLVSDPVLRDRFINQYALLLGSYLSADSITARIDLLESVYAPEIPHHLERQGGRFRGSEEGWRQQVNWFRTFHERRHPTAYQHLRQVFSLGEPATVRVATSPAGIRALRFNGSELMYTGIDAPFFTDLPLAVEASDRDHLLRFVRWVEDGDTNAIRAFLPGRDRQLTAEFTRRPRSARAGVVSIADAFLTVGGKRPFNGLRISSASSDTLVMDGWALLLQGSDTRIPLAGALLPGASLIVCSDTTRWRELMPEATSNIQQGSLFRVYRDGLLAVLHDAQGAVVDTLRIHVPDALLGSAERFVVARLPQEDGNTARKWKKKDLPWWTDTAPEPPLAAHPPPSITDIKPTRPLMAATAILSLLGFGLLHPRSKDRAT
jgi:hypothetical protein